MGLRTLIQLKSLKRTLLLSACALLLAGFTMVQPGMLKKEPPPAYIVNAYFSERPSSVKTLIYPTKQDYNSMANRPEGGFFVMDVAMRRQGLHHLEVEVRSAKGDAVARMDYDPVPSVREGFVHTIVGKLKQLDSPEPLTVYLFDQVADGRRKEIGTFNVLTQYQGLGQRNRMAHSSLPTPQPDPSSQTQVAAKKATPAETTTKRPAAAEADESSWKLADAKQVMEGVINGAMEVVERVSALGFETVGDNLEPQTLCWMPVSPSLVQSKEIKSRFPHFYVPLSLGERTFRLDGIGPYSSWLQARMAARQLTPEGNSQVLCIRGDGEFEVPDTSALTAQSIMGQKFKSDQGTYWYLIAATASQAQLSRIEKVMTTLKTPYQVHDVPVAHKRSAFVLMGPFAEQRVADQQVQLAREHLGQTGIWLHGGPVRTVKKPSKAPANAASGVVKPKVEGKKPLALSTTDPQARFVVMLGSYHNFNLAKKLVGSLRDRGVDGRIRKVMQQEEVRYVVYVGPYASWLSARISLRDARDRLGVQGGQVAPWQGSGSHSWLQPATVAGAAPAAVANQG
uniref:SPOR domain-containing protein n=1 Tax=Magnetococcus massalia (strain MO-1) TaxID=451514 RepID=A0A1S7LL85_MAGMO|nr:conserved exported protein of unknown function [Include 1 repeat domains involving in sporulation and cell division in some model bacteria] [Candidatus Magnetococcus massalia]